MELRNFILFLAFSTFLVLINAGNDGEGSGYIFTSPRTLKIGSNNQLQLLRYGNQEAGSVKVALFYKENYDSNETLKSENVFKFKKGQKQTFFDLFVAPFKQDDIYGGRLQIDGKIGYKKISGSDEINYASAKNYIRVIQTDKHLYKPGQTVRWRILSLNSDLKPTHQKDDAGDIYVEDPQGTRLFQSNGVYLGNGLTDSKFVLADEPLLGTWTITLKTNNGTTESTTFEVKEYDLPKFEVKITYPSIVLSTYKSVPITVCANFTYGKPVRGILNLNVSIDGYFYEYDFYSSYDKRIVDHKSFKLDGCYTYRANITALQQDPKDPNYYSNILVVANVVQEGTGVQINATDSIPRTRYPLSLDFLSDDYRRNYFKPGLPYNGKVQVTHADGTPASGEIVQLSYSVTTQRVIGDYLGTRKVKHSKNFTSDANGIIEYTIPPQTVETKWIYLQVQSFKYPNGDVLFNVENYHNLNPFYSPSGSYIQLAKVDNTIACGTKKQFQLLFTSKTNADYKFYYEVLKQGKVVQSGTQKVSFTEKDDISDRFNDDNKLINDKEETIIPSPKEKVPSSSGPSSSKEDEYPAAARASSFRYVPPVGEVKIPINVDYTLSGSFTLLMFYVRDDGETVADSRTFKVDKCFKNKVNFKFNDAVKRPGESTYIKVTASPNSLCGVRVIDKSVTLLGNNNDLTKDKIFKLIEAMDVGYYSDTNICNKDNPHQPGLPTNGIISPAGGYSSFYSDDSYSVFQRSGFLVISNLLLFTGKCEKPSFVFDEDGFRSGAASIGPPLPVDVRQNFPETWLFELDTVSSSGVLYSRKTLPDTITEWQGDAVCVNPQAGLGISGLASIKGFKQLFISYELPISAVRGEQFTNVVSIFSYAYGALPIRVSLDDPVGYEVESGSLNKDVCVKPWTSQSFSVKLKGTKIGKINITVRAQTTLNSRVCGGLNIPVLYYNDAIRQSLDIKAEGFPVEEVESILFCPLDEPNRTFKDSHALKLPNNAVKDSARAFVDVTGNILGRSIQNLDNLVSLPTGCGEQNLVKFVPNYLVLDYLKAIGELDSDTKNRAILNLNTGYQRELNYRHNDGSFSAFGPIDGEGSMFLTAFVIRSFYEAKRYIFIEDSIIESAQEWIVTKQKGDGCFPDIGQIIDRGLQGGIEEDNSPTTITAYVLASLLISNYQNQTVINEANRCLKNNPPKTPYEIFLVTYAEVLEDKTEEAQKRINDIKPLAQTGPGGVQTYPNPNGTDAINLETVAYAVLSNLGVQSDLNEIVPLIRGLAQNLNPNGGYYSTQDTCIGLAALSGFAKLVFGKPINIDVSISGALNKNFRITDDNKLLVQREQVTKVQGVLDISASGSGCGLIQVTFRYNSISPPNANKFYIKVLGLCSGKNCSDRKISGFVKHLPDGKAAGFSVVIISMQTGIVPDRDSIKGLPGANGNHVVRADVDGNNVVLYFKQINNKGEKFEFAVNRVIPVVHPQPGTATVTNYYNPEISTTTTYTFDDTK